MVLYASGGCSDQKETGLSPEDMPIAITGQDGPEILYFTISPEVGHMGDWYCFAWETRGADRVTIEPSITDLVLSPTGVVAGQVLYSTWFTLTAEKNGRIARKKAWVEVWFPGGSAWRMPRADASNSAYSPYPGPITNSIKVDLSNEKVKNSEITIGMDCSILCKPWGYALNCSQSRWNSEICQEKSFKKSYYWPRWDNNLLE